MKSNETVLVTGASGHLGRRVLELLVDAHGGDIIAVTRHPDRLAEFEKQGVEVRKGDFDEGAPSLAKAFAGAERLLLISTDAVGQPGRRLEQHQVAIAAAKLAGVRHGVYTSIARADTSKLQLAHDHLGTENALKASGLGWTLLRNNLYAESALFDLMQLPVAIASGKLATATGDGGAAFITREDCARAAAAALMSGSAESRTLEIGGPAVVTGKEIARLASEVTGRKIVFESIPSAALKAGLAQHGVPQPIVELVADFHTSIANGELAQTSPDFRTLTGRAAGSVAEFLHAAKPRLLQSA